MARQTDRQTTDRSTWWIVTAYNDNIDILENVNTYPKYVTKVYGGREKCPTTGREHFQGAIQCVSQVRLSSLLRWLPGTHMEPAKSAEAIKKYCMKEDTAIGEKTIRDQPNKYYSMHGLLTLMGSEYLKSQADGTYIKAEKTWKFNESVYETMEYWFVAKRILRREPHLITSLSDPRYKTSWCRTKEIWCEQGLSITDPADEEAKNKMLDSDI